MKSYRITKYNPSKRIDGKYLIDEWTSFSDVGKVFNGSVLKLDEYATVESSYIEFLFNIMKYCNVENIKICQLEKMSKVQWKDQQIITLFQVKSFIQDCLREKCWAKLEAENFFIHFGYDYYVYIGTSVDDKKIKTLAQYYNLFAEDFISPYL